MKIQLYRKILNWMDARYNLKPFKDFIEHKKVPVHKHFIWYYMGGITLFLFLIQVFTGLLLLLYYNPGQDTSFESVRYIVTKVKFGWLIRNVHSWSANLMVFFAFVHMFSVFFTNAYKKPRELTWVSGFILLVISMGFGFSGYLLPWNELAFFATKVGTDIAGAFPIVGDLIKTILRGGEDVTGATLSRFFGIHVAIFPAIFMIFLIVHLLMVQRQGMHEPESFKTLQENKKRYMPFFPDFALKDLLIWLIVFNVIIFLALYFPWELGLKADPFTPAPEGIKPEWYFMFMFQTLKELPPHFIFIEGEIFGILMFTVAGFIWMILPFIPIRDKKYFGINLNILIGLFVVGFIVLMTIIGYLT